MKSLTFIEAKPAVQTKKVAAYVRVSTNHAEQEDSLENQAAYYENVIRSNPDYEYAGIYVDAGISGFKDERAGFKKMIEDCRTGKIDLILTKSVSRFCRNAETLLRVTRELKELNIGVEFELQGINTLTETGELLLTIYAAVAQAESENVRELCKLVYRRKYEAGIPVQYLERSFGFCKDENGEYTIDENEAEWVRKAYQMVADGCTVAKVRGYFNENGLKSPGGVPWSDSAVLRMIQNEIYMGDYCMHKKYVNDHRKLVLNHGEEDSWYIEDDHVPIVSKKLWQSAQDALEKRREYLSKGSAIMEMNTENYPYMMLLFCSKCGHALYPRAFSNGNRLSWICSGAKRFGKQFCDGVNVPDSTIRGWTVDGNIYIYEKTRARGMPEFDFYRESYWKRSHTKKKPEKHYPDISEHPYREYLHCAECGSRLSRFIDSKSEKITWICGKYKREGSAVCKGVRIPDAEVQKWLPIETDIFIRERKDKDGEKRYTYSGETKDGGQGSK